MILEGIVTTRGISGLLNIAPMGSVLVNGLERFRLRPFHSSTTYKNLRESGEGVFHVTDDVLLIARAAIGEVIDDAPTCSSNKVRGRILIDSCRYYEFRVVEREDSNDPASFLVESVEVGRFRDFLGFNRAKHAVIEAAILATRVHLRPIESILVEFEKLKVIVGKTAGPDEIDAFERLEVFLQHSKREVPCADGQTPR